MFLSVVFVWFGSRLAGLGQIFSMNIGVLCHQPQHIAKHLDDLLSQQQRQQQRYGGVAGLRFASVRALRILE